MYSNTQQPLDAGRGASGPIPIPRVGDAEKTGATGPDCRGVQGLKWTLWDRWMVENDPTVQELLTWFQARISARPAAADPHPDSPATASASDSCRTPASKPASESAAFCIGGRPTFQLPPRYSVPVIPTESPR